MKIKRIIDVSRRIYPGMTIWPGDPSVNLKREYSISKGDKCNFSAVSMGVHTGTHLDAPLHFIDNGIDIASLDLSGFIGYVKVFSVASKKCISSKDIEEMDINEGDIVFFKTLNSTFPENSGFNKDFVYLDTSAAELLVEKKIKTVGVDYLSVDSYHSQTAAAHKILLSNHIGIIESLILKDINEGTYFFSCLPLKFEGADGSPARAVLIEFE